MIDVPRTSPEHPIIWSPAYPANGSRRRPMDVPIWNFKLFVKKKKKTVIDVKNKDYYI